MNLTAVPSDLLVGTGSGILQVLLSFNLFAEIGAVSLASEVHHSIRGLDLSHNKITSIDMNAFQWFPGLTALYLTNNMLNYLTPGLLAYNHNLNFLGLANNRFTRVPFIRYLPSLDKVSLGENPLNSISGADLDSFCGSVVALELNSVPQAAFGPDVLRNCTRLQTLTLADNFLHTIPDDFFLPCLQSIASVRLNVSR
jgi:Leucine-rich repeat (LRR) protein